ncbi:reverse transcriptase domain-containing protein, partial [Tanacetum coccineum]
MNASQPYAGLSHPASLELVRGLEIKLGIVGRCVAKEVAEVAKECGRGGQGSGRGGLGGGRDSQRKVIRLVKGGVFDLIAKTIPTIVAQVGNHVNNQGNNGNQDDNVINNNNQGNVWTVNLNNDRGGCSYKEFMACNPKDYDGKGDVIVYTRWIEKMESVQDMSGCGENQKVKYNAGSFIPTGQSTVWPMVTYTDRFHELARLVPHLVTPENKRIERYIYGLALQIRTMVAATEPITILSVVLKTGMLTDEAIRNEALKKNAKKRGNNGESEVRDGMCRVRDSTKRSRTLEGVCSHTQNHVGKEYTGYDYDTQNVPKTTTITINREPGNTNAAREACFECGGTDHYKAACPRLNRAPRPRGNHPNQVMAIKGGQGRGNNGNQAQSSNLGFSYEIKIASGQLVEINKVIQGCKLEMEGHIFDIDLIPFRHGSFDVIVGMDWLSKHKSKIVFHEKVVRIPLPNGEILRVLGERPEEK